MATNTYLNQKGKRYQLTVTGKISDLTGGLTNQFVLPPGMVGWTAMAQLAGAGSLQLQKSANDPGEVENQKSSSGVPQLWSNVGTSSTGGTVQPVDGAGSPTMIRGQVTGGAGTDVWTITITATIAG